MNDRLKEILSKDPVRNANLMHFAGRYGIDSCLIVGASALVRGTSDHTWVYLAPASQSEGRRLLEALDSGDHYLVGMDAWMLEALGERFEAEWILRCRKLVWPASRPPEPPSQPVRPLRTGDAAHILAHSDYQAFTDLAYVEDQIRHGIGGGIAAADGSLVAWALTHDDGAIGFLHVLDPFRRMGYGGALMRWMVRQVLASGRIPYVHIEAANRNSMDLAVKTGFQAHGEIWWVKGRLKGRRAGAGGPE